MKFGKHLGILFLFVIVASSLFATVSEKPRQGLVSIFEDLQPATEARESVSDTGVQPLETVTPRHTNQFTGRRWDSFSQTYNHRNRQMNPKYGRFISIDPLRFERDINLYRYGNGNPLRYTDPDGRGWFDGLASGSDAICKGYDHCYKQFIEDINKYFDSWVVLNQINQQLGNRHTPEEMARQWDKRVTKALDDLDVCLEGMPRDQNKLRKAWGNSKASGFQF